jgi:nitrogenase molybdenum-iron protein NifN
VLCASGGRSGKFEQAIAEVVEGLLPEPPEVREGVDFYDIAEEAEALEPDLIIGNSKGYHLAKRWSIPLIRVGFPIHDRFGGHRTLHLGYRGAQSLLDTIINTVIAAKQEHSPIGYSYI